MSVVVGPVPVRRLGFTLFVETVPARWCSYACSYCHGDQGADHRLNRSPLSNPDAIMAQVADRLASAAPAVDRIAIASAGEPTLDVHLGQVIDRLGELGKPVAVLSNGSLLTRDDVRAELGRADWVSLTFDAAREASWHAVNAPHPSLRFDLMLQGFRVFAAGYGGQLATKTMLIPGWNTSTRDLEATADFISRLEPAVSFLAVPSGSDTAKGNGPAQPIMERAAAVFAERLPRVECLAVHREDTATPEPQLEDGTTPFAGRCFASFLHRKDTQTLRPLATAKPAAGPSLARARPLAVSPAAGTDDTSWPSGSAEGQ